MSGIKGADSVKKGASSSPEKSPRAPRTMMITKCPVTGMPLDERHDDASGSSCSEAASTSTWAPPSPGRTSTGSEVPHYQSSPSHGRPSLAALIGDGWVRQQVESFETGWLKPRCSEGPDSPRVSDCNSASNPKHEWKPKPLTQFINQIWKKPVECSKKLPETEIPQEADDQLTTLDIIIQEHQQQCSAQRQQRQQRDNPHNRRGAASESGMGSLGGLVPWLDPTDPHTPVEKEEIQLMYLLLTQFLFDIMFHAVCISVTIVGAAALRCHLKSSTTCFLRDIVINFAIGVPLDNTHNSKQGTLQIGGVVIGQKSWILFSTLAWAIFNFAYYCAAVYTLTNAGETFRRYKAFTAWCVVGILGSVMVMIEYRSALSVLLVTTRLCILWRAWALRHAANQSSLLHPRGAFDVWELLLGPLAPVSRRRQNPPSSSEAALA